ncbi:coiled-coil domain-containing protein 158-like [Macrosteles quadrilineatus]|uniref:coiled-coil domain-containing protein 158-like n=1 Tax=Macrosteles quadrilineatus TaxID=74068 RepID=UPI0023E0BED5|nr:coiled-coil domain-containing protein 158-like [Macrosteles quadrilineatus]XP_054262967.1 coiled-coil domain-containing protein 158-like [Macrosteles quadrilineatus]
MKITAPDDIEIPDELKGGFTSDEDKKVTFEDEIKDILRMTKLSPKFVVENNEDRDNLEFKREVLFKFTQLCREELFPRHLKAVEATEAKMDQQRCQLLCQQKQIQHLLSSREELRENLHRLEVARAEASSKDLQLQIRLKEVFEKLQNRCKNSSWSERKAAQDLIALKKRVEDIKLNLMESKAKMNYYRNQVQVQTETVKKQTKPLHLDKNKAALMKESLSDMRENIEQLMLRVKKLKVTVESTNNGSID